eukprot:gene5920-5989_t
MTNHLGGIQRGDEQRWQVDGASHEKGELLMAIKRLKKILLALLTLALLPIVPILTASTAHAVGSPFACNANFYQISNGQFYQLNVPGFTYSKVGSNASIGNLNSAGWNPADNYIYAMSSNTTLQQIASDGSITSPGSITGLTAENGGDFISSDKMIVVSSGSANIQLLTLNRTSGSVTSGTATNITTTGSGYTGSLDIAIFPSTGGTYVGYSLNGTALTTFTFPNGSPTTASYTTKTVTGLQNGASGAFGAQWVDSQGNFYAYDNTVTPSASTNALYEINRTDLNSVASTIPAQDVAEETSPGTPPNDGVSCRTAPSVFAPQMTTTASITNVTGTTALATGYLVTNVYPVNPLGNENNAKICYSTSSATDSTPGNTYGLLLGASCFTTSQTFPANTSTQNFSVTLTGLSPNTTYYYQSAAVNTPSPSTISPFAGFSPVASFTTPAIPTFTSISPSSGTVAGGTSATITGTNFTGATSVTIDGIPVTSFTVNSPTSITITTPAGTSLGAKNVVVTAPGGTATGPGAFTYVGQITFNANGGTGTMSPQTGSAPATINANTFTYAGSTFLGWNTAANGSGTAYAAGATYPFSSSTTLYAQWLTVASVAPPSGPLGSTTPITITGTGFTGATGVTIGGAAATSVVVVNSTTITAVVPTSATVGAKDVVVTTPAGTGTGTGKFTYNATVTFNGNGSDGGSTSAQLASTATALTSNGFTRTGYTFAGWNTQAGGGGTSYANGASFPFTADTTLYAQWTAINYSVTYDKGTGGSGTPPTDGTAYIYGQSVTTKPSTGLSNGTKVFAGWNTATNGTGTTYAASQSAAFNITSSLTLYALWNTAATPTLTNVSVTSGDVSGGTTSVLTGTNFLGTTSVTIGGVPVTSFVVNSATQITIVTAPNAPGLNDNIIVTTVDGTVTGAAGKQFTYQATVTFLGNGNTSGSTAAQTAHVNPTALSPNGFIRTGYTFSGWNTVAGGGGTAYGAGANYSFTADLTLYAQWTPSTFAVTYNPGTGGTGTAPTDPSSPYAAGATVTVVAGIGTLSKTNSFFAGWNTATNGSGTMYAAGATFTMPGNALPLYAIWGATAQAAPTISSVSSANTGDVSGGTTATITGTNFYGTTGVQVNCNGSLINVTSWVVNSSTQITVVMPACAKTGAAGFQVVTKPNLTYLNSGTPATTGVKTFTYTAAVILNSNGGSGTMATQNASTYIALTSQTFTPPTGYTAASPFWSTNPGGGGTTYSDGANYHFDTATTAITLYAQWTPVSNAVTYNANGGTGSVPVDGSSPHATGSTVTVLGNTGPLTLTNQTFYGWNTAADGSGTAYTPGATFTMPSNAVILYAQWTSVTSVSPNTGTLNGGTPITITGKNFTGATGATINGVAVTSFVVVNPTTITAVAPAGTTGAAKNIVVSTSTGSATGTGLYTYFATVTFNNNGGSGTMAIQTASVTTALTTNTFTRSLYTFSGWNTAADYSGTSYANAASYPFTADVTLYAKWLGPPSITTVTPNVGPLAGGTSVTVTGTNFTGATSVTIDGVPVTSYTVNSSTSITLTTPAGSTIGAKNLVITTPYGIATGTGVYSYQTTVIFNSNGGTGTMANQSASAATALTANAFTYANSIFLGWNTAANGSGTAYADLASYSFTANTTLYAQWLHVTSVSPTSGTLAGGTAITITGTGFTGATGVTIGGVAATSVVVVNSTTITAVTPAGTSIGAKDIVVTIPAGSATGIGLFTYNAIAITITSNAASKIYGASDPSLTGFTITSGALKSGDVIGSVSASRVAGENVGTYNVTPSAAVFTTGSASNYTITYATGTFTVAKAALTITASSTSVAYGA